MLDRLRWSLSQCQISSNCLHFIHCLRLLYHDICISCLVHVHDMCTICQLFLHAGFSHLCWLHYMFIHWVLSVVCNCFVWITYTSIFEDRHSLYVSLHDCHSFILITSTCAYEFQKKFFWNNSWFIVHTLILFSICYSFRIFTGFRLGGLRWTSKSVCGSV